MAYTGFATGLNSTPLSFSTCPYMLYQLSVTGVLKAKPHTQKINKEYTRNIII